MDLFINLNMNNNAYTVNSSDIVEIMKNKNKTYFSTVFIISGRGVDSLRIFDGVRGRRINIEALS